jgi:hypothetical protein
MSECSSATGNFTQGRLTQINNYKTQSYRFLTAAMGRYSLALGILIVFVILRNAEIISGSIFALIASPVLAYLIIDMLYTFYSFKSRGPFNFDTMIWKFNKTSAPTTTPNGGTGGGDIGGGGYGPLSGIQCYNGSCCGDGMTWDSEIGKCTLL